MTKYFLIVASKDHVLKGVEGGFAQACHGKRNPMSKPQKGDWIVYYSSKELFESKKPFQKFTAIGQIADELPELHVSSENFKPYRRKVIYSKCKDAEIRPLLNDLSFIKNKDKWGFYLMSGFLEISKDDFEVIKMTLVS